VTIHLKKPFFGYDGPTYVYPDITAENIIETDSVERFDHTAADGTTAHCYVGDRNFYEFTYRWVDSSTKSTLETLWDTIKNGEKFDLIWDDSVRKMDGTWDMDGTYTMGTDAAGDVIVTTEYVTAQTEMVWTPEEVYGYWQVTMRMRETV
jgi:hypothetical protein